MDDLRVLQPLGQRRALGDAVQQKLPQAALAARAHEIRPGHHAHTSGAVLQGDEPEPAVIEPVDGDVALRCAGVAARIGEVREHGHAVVARVLVPIEPSENILYAPS